MSGESLRGVPLNTVMDILGKQGLVVEGAHASGVNSVSVTDKGSTREVAVTPIVVFEGDSATTIYRPKAT